MNASTTTISPIIMNYRNNIIINNDKINTIINDDDNFLVERWAHVDQRLRELYYGYYAQDQDQEDQDQEDQDQDTSLEIIWETPESPTATDRLMCQSPIPFNYCPFIEAVDQMINAENESDDTDSTLSLSDDELGASRE